jgi:hypothetical protein
MCHHGNVIAPTDHYRVKYEHVTNYKNISIEKYIKA